LFFIGSSFYGKSPRARKPELHQDAAAAPKEHSNFRACLLLPFRAVSAAMLCRQLLKSTKPRCPAAPQTAPDGLHKGHLAFLPDFRSTAGDRRRAIVSQGIYHRRADAHR
jgi:hypothetical protein